MNRSQEIKQLQRDIFSEDWEKVKTTANRLAQIGGDDVVDFLIELLDHSQSGIRNRAALALRDLKDNRAVEPLFKSIFKPENKNYTGTMVYALETLDCKDKLVELFYIVFYHLFESKLGAYTVLSEQIFEFSRKDLHKIQQMWLACNKNPEQGEGFDDEETKELMQDVYDGFIGYLEE